MWLEQTLYIIAKDRARANSKIVSYYILTTEHVIQAISLSIFLSLSKHNYRHFKDFLIKFLNITVFTGHLDDSNPSLMDSVCNRITTAQNWMHI